MATDVEKLIVQVSADLKSFENAMAKATGITRSQLAQIKADATQAGAAGAAAFTGASQGVQRFGQQAQKTGQNVVNLRGQTANLAAQFQDIGVQLQSGTSPLTVALQQGTQISAVLGGAGAGGAVKALGAAFLSVVNPVSLVTIGLIAAGGAAVQYFSGMASDGEKTEAQLKEQANLIRQVAKEWEGAIPALDAYIAQLDELKRIKDTRAAVKDAQVDLFVGALEEVQGMQREVLGLTQALGQMGQSDAAIKLSQAFAALAQKLEDGTASGDDARAALEILNSVTGNARPLVEGLSGALSILAGRLDTAAGSAANLAKEAELALASSNRLNNLTGLAAAGRIYKERIADSKAVVAEQERLNGLTTEQLAIENETNRLVEEGVINRSEAAALAGETIAAEKARADAAKAAKAAGSGSDKAAAAAEREREAVRKLVEQLEFENTLIGLSNVEREKAIKLRQATADNAATPEDIARIEAAVEQSYRMNDAIKANEESLERLRSVSKSVLSGMFEDLRDGADMAEVLSNALNRVAESLITAGIDTAITAAFGKPGTPSAGTNFLSDWFRAPVHHQGGVVGEPGPSRLVSPAAFRGAPRYHNGGVAGIRPGEVPAILQKGERVLPRGAGGGGDVTVQIIGAPAGTKVQESRGADGERMVRVLIKQAVDGLMSDGSLDRSMATNFGVRRRAG